MKIDEIKELMTEMRLNNINFLEYEGEGSKLKLKIEGLIEGNKVIRESNNMNSVDELKTIEKISPEIVEDIKLDYIKSPIVGTFYGKPGPDKNVFVNKGDTIKKGTVVCIVEAMKVMNEIVADCDMKVIDSLVSDEDIVEYGQNLYAVEFL